MNFLKKIFTRKQAKKVENSSMSKPDNWNKTFSDLMKEMDDGKRTEVGQPETEWAREYEQSLIPKTYRYPKQGDLYESKNDQEIEFMTAWSAPFTGGGVATLFKGEQIWVNYEPNEEKPIGCYTLPVKYQELEKRMVTESDRTKENYGNFYFYFDTIKLNENFNLLKTDFTKEQWD